MWETTLRLDELATRGGDARGVSIRKATDADTPAIRALYREDAQRHDGLLDRTDFHWSRIHTFRNKPADIYVAERDGAMTGYVFIIRTDDQVIGFDLRIVDMAASDRDSADRLLAFLGDHRSVAKEVMIPRPMRDPIFAHVREHGFRSKLLWVWMIRIVNVEQALMERGYHDCVAGELHIDIEDEILTENSGRYVVQVADGRATAASGGRGDLTMHARGLATMFSGYRSATQLLQSGLISGDAKAARTADLLFASTGPWTPEMY